MRLDSLTANAKAKYKNIRSNILSIADDEIREMEVDEGVSRKPLSKMALYF